MVLMFLIQKTEELEVIHLFQDFTQFLLKPTERTTSTSLPL